MIKLLQLLLSFTPAQQQTFLLWLGSPWFNTDKSLAKISEMLYAKENTISMEELWKAIFPTKAYNQQVLKNKLSQLGKKAESFSAFCVFETDEQAKQWMLNRHVSENTQTEYAQKHFKRQKPTGSISLGSLDFEQKQSELNFRLSQKAQRHESGDALRKLISDMDNNWLANRLKFTCEMLNRGLTLGGQLHDIAFNEVLQHFPPQFFAEHLLPRLYRLVYLTITHPDAEDNYHSLKNELKTNFPLISTTEASELFTFLQNYCIRRITAGKQGFLRELFENYKLLLQSELLLPKGQLGEFDFKNIITVALRLGEGDWALNFIETYHTKLDENHRANALAYNQARIFYAQKDLKNALKTLTKVEYSDVFYHIDSRTLLVKIYLDLEDVEGMLTAIASFRAYLLRSKLVAASQQKLYLNFLNLAKRLAMLMDGSEVSIPKMQEFLAKTPQTAEAAWLREKVDKLGTNGEEICPTTIVMLNSYLLLQL